jgi:hypothetical protein
MLGEEDETVSDIAKAFVRLGGYFGGYLLLLFAVAGLASCATAKSAEVPPPLNGESPHVRVHCDFQNRAFPGPVRCKAFLHGQVPQHWLCLKDIWTFGDGSAPKTPNEEITCTEEEPGRVFTAEHKYIDRGSFDIRVQLEDARGRKVAHGFRPINIGAGGGW